MRNERYLELARKTLKTMDSFQSVHEYYIAREGKRAAEVITVEFGDDSEYGEWYYITIGSFFSNGRAGLSVTCKDGKVSIEHDGYFLKAENKSHTFKFDEIESFIADAINEFAKIDTLVVKALHSDYSDDHILTKIKAYSRYTGIAVSDLKSDEIDDFISNSIKLEIVPSEIALEKDSYFKVYDIDDKSNKEPVYFLAPEGLTKDFRAMNTEVAIAC